MNKLERLGCLYLTFLNNPRGLAFAEIREYLPLAYDGDSEAARRKFERDKDDLRELGMDLRHYADGQALPDGNIADGHIYIPVDELRKMPELRLSADQARALATVLSAAIETADEEFREDLESAATKILYKNPGSLPGPGAVGNPTAIGEDAMTELLGLAHEALLRHRVLELEYPDGKTGTMEKRQVEGRGLIAHRGRWCLIAYCRRARDIRSFYLDRAGELRVTEVEFKPDRKFNLREHSLHPLSLRIHEPTRVELVVGEEKEEELREFLAGLPERKDVTPEWDDLRVSLGTTNQEALFSWMTRHPGAIEKIGPESVRERFIEYLGRMRALHE